MNTTRCPRLHDGGERAADRNHLGQGQHVQDYLSEKGDVDRVWDEADYIVEGEYTTGAQEQLYIENNGIIAAFDPTHGVTVWGSLQCPLLRAQGA